MPRPKKGKWGGNVLDLRFLNMNYSSKVFLTLAQMYNQGSSWVHPRRVSPGYLRSTFRRMNNGHSHITSWLLLVKHLVWLCQMSFTTFQCGKTQCKFLVLTNYFTKWIEVKPLTTILAYNVKGLIRKKMLYVGSTFHILLSQAMEGSSSIEGCEVSRMASTSCMRPAQSNIPKQMVRSKPQIRSSWIS